MTRIALCMALLALGCGDDDGRGGGDDAGGGRIDAGGSGSDGGADPDAGSDTDAGGGPDDAGERTDSGGGPIDSGSGETDAGPGPTDAGCTPETDDELCAAAGAECGGLTGTDRCGSMRAPDCGTCEGPAFIMCAGNACGCAMPPTPSYVGCVADATGIRFTTGGVEQLWYTRARTGLPLGECGAPRDYMLVSDADLMRGRVNLPGGPSIGECMTFRLCARDSRCTDEWSGPLDVEFCVDGTGTMPTCSMR
jgi:hypothetical protein